MAKSKKHVLSIEVYKYPYCGTLDDTENYLSNKICCYTNGVLSSQAIGLPISTQTPPIMRSIHSNVGLSKKAIIAQVIKEMSAKIDFTEKEIDQL